MGNANLALEGSWGVCAYLWREVRERMAVVVDREIVVKSLLQSFIVAGAVIGTGRRCTRHC